MCDTSMKLGMVVGVDGSAESDAAVRWATTEAVMRGLPVTLIHAIAPVVVSWPIATLEGSFLQWQDDNARQVIEQARKTVQASVGRHSQPPAVHTDVQYANPGTALVTASRDAAMVVVGSRGASAIGRLLLGSVSRGVVHHAHCPVAVIRGDVAETYDDTSPVLVGIDGSPASEAAIALAFDEASRRGVDLIALHAWSDVAVFPILGMDWRQYEDRGHEVLAERLAGWQEQYPDVGVRRRVVCDRPARWLIDESRHAQLVVVGSRGRGGFAGTLLGSVASAVVQESEPPVIVVRPR